MWIHCSLRKQKCTLKSTTTNRWLHFGQSEQRKSSVLFPKKKKKCPDSGFFTCDPTKKCTMPSSRERHKRDNREKAWSQAISSMASHANLQKRREALTRCCVTSHRHAEWVNKRNWKTIESPPSPLHHSFIFFAACRIAAIFFGTKRGWRPKHARLVKALSRAPRSPRAYLHSPKKRVLQATLYSVSISNSVGFTLH